MIFSQKTETLSKCEENIEKTMLLYDKLVFILNLKKSQIISTQKLKMSGFQIDFVKMINTSAHDKKQKLKIFDSSVAKNFFPCIRFLAKVIETILSCMPALKLGPFFYQALKNDKTDIENE